LEFSSFALKIPWARLAVALIFLASLAISALLMMDNILSAKKTSKWLMAITKLALPKVGNEEYQYRISKHKGDTLWSANRRCQRQPSSSSKTRISPGLLVTSPPGTEHSGIWVQGSNIREIRPVGSDLLWKLEF